MALYAELKGRTAVVTGAARGIGCAFSRGLARQGANVVAADIDDDSLGEAVRAINAEAGAAGEVLPIRMDVTSRSEHDRVAAVAQERFGDLTYWVNNAGVFPEGPVLEVTAERFQATMTTNAESALHGSQAAAARMSANGGAIVNMSSISAFTVRPGRGAYGVSKAAADHLTRFLAVELAPLGIRVNAIAPGIVDTEMIAWLRSDPDALERAIETIPLRRIGTPDEVCDAMLFLLSDSARYITGHTLVVDGGTRHHR
jgi:3-oxoacyl-[acyl-carrier protein] reductase